LGQPARPTGSVTRSKKILRANLLKEHYMKLKQKLIAAAVALVAASGAHASIANSISGNGSLVLFTYDTGSNVTAMYDLGVNMDSFLPDAMSSGGSITWNLNASTVAGTGAYSSFSAALNYGSVYSSFAPQTSVKWGVIALDSTGTALGNDRYLSTSKDTFGTVDNQTKTNLVAFGPAPGIDSFLNAHSNLAGHSDADGFINGASLSTDAGATTTAQAANGFGTSGKWKDKASFVAVNDAGAGMGFFYLDTLNSTTNSPATTYANVIQYGNAAGNATFLYDDVAGTLTFNQIAVVPAIPEPSEYALMLAGLGMLGFMARRRLANRV
jgi:hypothetical protein